MTGRPTDYTEALVNEFLTRVEDGESIRKICESDNMPTRETIRVWLRDKPEFSVQYAHAREESADKLAEEIVDIADAKEGDPHTKRVRIDARKWVAAKMKPKKYGDKLDMNLSGGLKIDSMTPEQLAQAKRAILAKYNINPDDDQSGGLNQPDTDRASGSAPGGEA